VSATLKLEGTPLARVLLRKPADTARTRRYQAVIDQWVDHTMPSWDLATGMIAADPPLTGRSATAPLALAAFCWHSPLSRHHGDPRLLAFFAAGLDTFTGSIREDGLMERFGLNGQGWAHGWDVEGLIYGLVFCRAALEPALLRRVRDRFALSARRHASLPETHSGIGGIGNQRCVWALGLHLYGQVLDDPDMIALADRHWNEVAPKVLDASGQVIEQLGPCMHYSYTAFFYAWLNTVIRDDPSQADRLLDCLNWFRCRHTESLYPLAGPSARQYYETVPYAVADLLGAAGQAAGRDSRPLLFAERAVEAVVRRMNGELAAPETTSGAEIAVPGHGASPWLWAILMAGDDTLPEPPPPAPVWLDCTHSTLLHRSPLAYMLVRGAYQTHFNLTDFLPFSGVQTWAFGSEPPLVHPTPLAPSTTQADRLDTARQGVSHNWGLYGAGALAPDCVSHTPATARDLRFITARYDWLWRLVFFTDRSTVILEFGNGGPRRTLWTLNRVEPAVPKINGHTVRFEGRAGCLHTTLAEPPEIVALTGDDPWARGVRQLRYACGPGPAAFAFSDGSFRFLGEAPRDAAPWRFADAGGEYEVTLCPRFFTANPGNFREDVYHLAKDTTARCLKESIS
jgi:hypothetical protein